MHLTSFRVAFIIWIFGSAAVVGWSASAKDPLGLVVAIALDPVIASPTASYDDMISVPVADIDYENRVIIVTDLKDGWVPLRLKSGEPIYVESYNLVFESPKCGELQSGPSVARTAGTGLGAGEDCE